MSDTPRTDDARIRVRNWSGKIDFRLDEVPLEFARQLERELSQAKAEIAAVRAENAELRKDATVKAGRLLYIADNMNDNVAIRFGLEAREEEIIAVMKDAGWPIDARKAQP